MMCREPLEDLKPQQQLIKEVNEIDQRAIKTEILRSAIPTTHLPRQLCFVHFFLSRKYADIQIGDCLPTTGSLQ